MAAAGEPAPPRAAPPSVLHSATLADALADKHAATPDRRSVLLLEHNMTVADALEVRRGCAGCAAAAYAPVARSCRAARYSLGEQSASR